MISSSAVSLPSSRSLLPLLGIVVLAWAAQMHTYEESEPFYNNDETRHLMTGVFVRDAVLDGKITSFREYPERYFLQYPALGLLTWPPFYYGVEGLWFLAFGPSFLAGRILMGLHATASIGLLHALVTRTHGRACGWIASLFLSFSPLFFSFSRQIMLEIPTLTYSLAALYFFLRFVEGERWRDVLLAAAFTAFAALTRFDGFFLFPVFGLILLGKARLRLLWSRKMIVSVLLGAVLVGPYYVYMVRQIGWFHWQAISVGTSPESTGLFDLKNFYYYFTVLPKQVTWWVVPFAAIGFALSFWGKARLKAALPYLALACGTYLMVVPVAELNPRHTIYWIPAACFFAADAILAMGKACRKDILAYGLAAACSACLLVEGLGNRAPFVRGYAEAAEYVLKHTTERPFCLFDGLLNGDFIYQMRMKDQERKIWTLRGDKVFYSVLSDPRAGYKEHMSTKTELQAEIERYDPELIILESPQILFNLPAAERLREHVEGEKGLYRLEATFDIVSNVKMFEGKQLKVYRKLARNPHPAQSVEFELMGLRRSINTNVPRS